MTQRPALRRLSATMVAATAPALLALLPAAPAAQASEVAHAAGFSATFKWTQVLPDAGSPVALSSPNVANLDGQPSVVVGDRSGRVYAYHLNGGSQVGGWPYNAGAPVDSSPSVAPINAYGLDTVYVGSGNAASPNTGGYQAISPGGGDQWFVPAANPPTDPGNSAVAASLTVGNYASGYGVEAGSLGQNTYALNAANGALFGGFPWFSADSVFSTAAVADLYADGNNEIISGGDSSAGGPAYGQYYSNGGHIRILSSAGNAGSGSPSGGLICQYNTNQNIDRSSPAVGQFLAGGGVGIAIGDGSYYSGASDSNKVFAINTGCGLAWSDTLNGITADSPALASVTGSSLDVVEGTQTLSNQTGTVYVLNGTNGAIVWQAAATGEVIGSPVTADLTGQGYQDVIAATTNGIDIFDGRSGTLVDTLAAGSGFQNSALVTNDPDGHIGITGAGYAGGAITGVIDHWEIDDTGHATPSVYEGGAWPQFHHDPQLTGDAGTPGPTIEVPCNAPAGGPNGYLLSASDGGVFDYGNIPFCGSTGSIHLNKPVVSSALTRDGGGYWEVASDGGIFSFGDAGFYGSMGGTPLNQPIVGMAATPDGKGYWEVAADGGIFSFGDAHFYGSTGSIHLNRPIVGMATTSDGKGYWLVASDGGVFTYGDARFQGSMGGRPLNLPIVGMAADNATGGYWEVASDGGIFAFGAPFYGSTGSLHLNAPIVGMEANHNGSGYRFVASDGGIFSYNAPFYGSMGGRALNRPVVSMAGS